MGVVQVRPWDTHGFFFKTGMGAGIVGNGLIGPLGTLEAPFTTNTLALVYGAGWVFRREQRFALQVHGTHHIAALGEVTTKDEHIDQKRVGQRLECDGGNRVPLDARRLAALSCRDEVPLHRMRSDDNQDPSPAEFKPAVFIPAELPEHDESR